MLPEGSSGVFDSLITHQKQFVLPLVIQREYDIDVGQSEGCLVNDKDECYPGSLFNNKVMYPDPANSTKWIPSKLEALLKVIKDTHKTDIAGKQHK